jgi:O-antigen ligase
MPVKRKNYFINKELTFKNLSIFLVLASIFFWYFNRSTSGNDFITLFVAILCLIIFMVSVNKVVYGLYCFIFSIPLFNSLTTILEVRHVSIVLFSFFALFLGFFVNKASQDQSNKYDFKKAGYQFNEELKLPVLLFGLIIIISTLIIIYRYANFIPFLSSKYYDLNVNVNGVGSTEAIFWTIRFFFNYIIGFGLLFIIYNTVRSIKEVVLSIVVLISATIVSVFFLFYQYYFDPTIGNFVTWIESGRYNATFGDPNALGAYIVIVFPLFIALFFYFKKWYSKLLIGLSFLLFALMPLFSGSRTSLFGNIFSILCLIIIGISRPIIRLSRTYSKRKRIIISLIVPILCVIILVTGILILFNTDFSDPNISGFSIINRSIESLVTFKYYVTNSGLLEGIKSVSNYRYLFWEWAIQMFQDYPLSGVGLGAFVIELPQYQVSFSQIDFTGNYYLQILSEFGVIGLLSILSIFFIILWKAIAFTRRNTTENKNSWIFLGLFLSFLSMLAALLLGPHTNFDEIQLSFWLVIGLMAAFMRINDLKEDDVKRRTTYSLVNSRQNSNSLINRNQIVLNKIGFSMIIFIFSVSFLYSSFIPLSINVNQKYFRMNQNEYGFYGKEVIDGKEVEWIGINASKVIEKQGNIISIPFKDGIPVERKSPNSIRFYVDNKLVRILKVNDNDWHNISIKIPDFTGDRFTLTITCSDSWSPKEFKINNDTRELGLLIGKIEFLK